MNVGIMYEMLLMYVKGIFKKFYKIFYCLVDRVVFLFIVYCVVGFFRVFLFVFVINDKLFYKKI